MKTKALYPLLPILLGFFTVAFAQEKKEEGFKCPCDCNCIEVATDGTIPRAVMKNVPFDEPFMLYWKKGDAVVLNGTFEIRDKAKKTIEQGMVSTHGDYVIARVSSFLRPHRDYEISFEIGQGPALEFRKVVRQETLNFFVDFDDSAAPDDQAAADALRKKIYDGLPVYSLRFIKPGSLLDARNSFTLDTGSGAVFQDIRNWQSVLKKIETEGNLAYSFTKSMFQDETVLDKIKKLYGDKLHKSIQELSTKDDLAKKVFSGRVSLLALEELPEINVKKLDAALVKQYIKNIDELIKNVDNWEAKFSLNTSVKSKLTLVSLNLNSLLQQIPLLEEELNGFVKGSFIEKVITSFVLSMNSNVLDLETSTRTYVGIDMGLMLTKLTDKPDGHRMLPYAGLSLSLMPVNKKASLGRLWKTYKGLTLLKTLSLHTGVTLPTLNTPDYQGILNLSDPKGVIVGLGIRPWRAIKLSFGWLLLNRPNGNTLASSYHVSSNNYFSVSLDSDVRSIITDVRSFFTK